MLRRSLAGFNWRYCCAAIIFLTLAGSAHAAETSLTGKVQDASGAAVASARVSLKLEHCSCKDCPEPSKCNCCPDQRTVTADGSGSYSVSIPAGDYKVTVTAPGFKVVSKDIKLEAGQSVELNLKIE